MARLLVKFKSQILQEVNLGEDPVRIGRTEDNEIVLDNLGISRNHARIYKKDNKFVLEDLGSCNGIFINSELISESQELENKDIISIGKYHLVYLERSSRSDLMHTTRRRSLDPNKITRRMLPPDQTLQVGSKADVLAKISRVTRRKNKDSIPKIANIKQAWVEMLSGVENKTLLKIDKPLIKIGKGIKADIIIEGDMDAGVAFVITEQPGKGYFISPSRIVDLRIDGQPITEAQQLNDGNIIEVGEARMKFSEQDRLKVVPESEDQEVRIIDEPSLS